MATKTMNFVSLGDIGSQTDYQTQDDLRTLSRASIIKKDKKRFNAAMKLAQDQISQLENLDPDVESGEDEKEGEKDD